MYKIKIITDKELEEAKLKTLVEINEQLLKDNKVKTENIEKTKEEIHKIKEYFANRT